jgi:hypothetical protein
MKELYILFLLWLEEMIYIIEGGIYEHRRKVDND